MDYKILILASTIIFGIVELTDGANILVIMPLPARSHFICFRPLWEGLIERGHNLTFISGYKLDDKFQQNYTLIDVKPVFSQMKGNFAAMRKQNSLHNLISYHYLFHGFIDEILKYTDVQNLIASNNKYDLVIAEMAFIDAVFAFGNKFDAPVIAAIPLNMFSIYDWILGNPFPSSYIPNTFLHWTEKMSLYARIVNTVFNYLTILFYEFVCFPRIQTQIEKYFHFNKENTPHIKNIMKNISVTFVNSHYTFGYVKPNFPNIVNIAGLHLTVPAPIPKNIEKFMDEAEHGVIYLSLGSLIEPSKLEDLGLTLIDVLEKLPQRIVMKWDAKLLPYIPENVLVQDWISQEAVLHHPKCRIFITHGGLHSTLEGLNASVPLVGLPFFVDQHHNMAIVEYYEIGTIVNVNKISEELPLKIDEVLNNPKYKKNIVKKSQLFRDRQNTPLETAMYWVNHVIHHKASAHLRSVAAELKWYEYYSLDVLVVLAAVLWVIIKTVPFLIRRVKQKLSSIKNYFLALNSGKMKK